MMDDKNRLQDYLQKRALPHARYETSQVRGPPHCPVWQSTAVLHDGTGHRGSECITKLDAQFSAARAALKHCQEEQGGPTLLALDERLATLNLEERASWQPALLVDVENMPKLIEQLSAEQLQTLTVYAFIGEHHHMIDKLALPPTVTLVSTNSTRKDGTDCCMQVFTGALLARNAHPSYLVATGDRFGATLVEMIGQRGLGFEPVPAQLITRAEQLLKRHGI